MAGAQNTANLLNRLGKRSLEAGLSPDADVCGDADQREIGQGAINFAPMFAAATNRSRYYMERDPVGVGGPTNFNPFTNADNSLKGMRGPPAPVLKALPPTFTSVPAGTAAGDFPCRSPTRAPRPPPPGQRRVLAPVRAQRARGQFDQPRPRC